MDILDYFDELTRQNARTVAVKRYYFEYEAQIDAAALRDAGIPCFVSNALSSTNIPTSFPGIGLMVLEEDQVRAEALLLQNGRMDEGEAASANDAASPSGQPAWPGWLYTILVVLAIIVLAWLLSRVSLTGSPVYW